MSKQKGDESAFGVAAGSAPHSDQREPSWTCKADWGGAKRDCPYWQTGTCLRKCLDSAK